MGQDFLNSIALEDVSFVTQVVKKSLPGDNFYKLAVYIEGLPTADKAGIQSGRFIADPSGFAPLTPGEEQVYAAEVTKDTYSSVTTGLLKSWLGDFFASGTIYSAYLIVYASNLVDDPQPEDISAAIVALESAYNKTVALAYHKTVCAGAATTLLPDLAVALANLCAADRNLLSAAPYLPLSIQDASQYATDPIFSALAADDPTFKNSDAFMTAYADVSHNGSLFSLGLALSLVNATGTPVGNNIDFWATSLMAPSGPDGTSLSRSVRDVLKAKNIAFFKYVGDGTDDVAAVGVKTLGGIYMQAYWVVNYINYMCKTQVATYITQPNMVRSSSSYSGIINIMRSQINRFGPDGSGRLQRIVITAPPFASLPPAQGDEIIVPQAWSAEYTDQVHSVKVFGNLIISA